MKNGGDDHPKRKKPRGGTERETLAAALARADAAEAEVAKARAEVARANDEAARFKAEAARERIRAGKAYADTLVPGANLGAFDRPVNVGMRKRLLKILGMLGSDQAGERASAALIADKERAKLGMTWDELIVRVQTEDLDDLDFDDEDIDDDDIEDDLDDADLDDEDIDDDDDEDLDDLDDEDEE